MSEKTPPYSYVKLMMAKPKNPTPKQYEVEAPSGRVFSVGREERDILTRTFGWDKL